jgi:hypothetical protein
MLNQWNEFFVVVGGAAAALAGLVFVAMSLNLNAIIRDATHRSRAIGTLTGFTAAFMICAFALMDDQNYQAVGIEWLVVSTIAMVVYISGYVRAKKSGGSSVGLHPGRIASAIVLHFAQMLGSVLLFLGYGAGFYLAGVALVVYVGFMISGAWLLLISVNKG